MPTSLPEGKDWLAKRYVEADPDTVIDLGAGDGTYATLLRPEGDEAYWIGYEIWIPYVVAYHLQERYNAVVIQDIREAVFPKVDLIIAGDVLEHMRKREAVWLIDRMKLAANHIFVSLPIVHYPQGAVNGNPYEAHLHHWTHDEMLETLSDDEGDLESFVGEVIGAYHWSRDDGS